MNAIDAAAKVLAEAGKPLSYRGTACCVRSRFVANQGQDTGAIDLHSWPLRLPIRERLLAFNAPGQASFHCVCGNCPGSCGEDERQSEDASFADTNSFNGGSAGSHIGGSATRELFCVSTCCLGASERTSAERALCLSFMGSG